MDEDEIILHRILLDTRTISSLSQMYHQYRTNWTDTNKHMFLLEIEKYRLSLDKHILLQETLEQDIKAIASQVSQMDHQILEIKDRIHEEKIQVHEQQARYDEMVEIDNILRQISEFPSQNEMIEQVQKKEDELNALEQIRAETEHQRQHGRDRVLELIQEWTRIQHDLDKM